jgi:hypothetical protein
MQGLLVNAVGGGERDVGMINKEALIKFLEKRAVEAPVSDPTMLVNYAMYQGLADRIKHGEFDYVVNDDKDLVMDDGD